MSIPEIAAEDLLASPRHRELVERDRAIGLAVELPSARAELAAVRAELAAVTSSRSWRLGSGLVGGAHRVARAPRGILRRARALVRRIARTILGRGRAA